MTRGAWRTILLLAIAGQIGFAVAAPPNPVKPAAVAASGADVGEGEEAGGPTHGQDPVKPPGRFDLRTSYFDLADGRDEYRVILRIDKPFQLAPKWRLGTRIDLPLVINDKRNSDNPDGKLKAGTGELLTQLLLAYDLDGRTTLAGGLRTRFPTISQDGLGSGKFVLIPTAGFRTMLPEISKGSFISGLVRYQASVGGDPDRADISRLQMGPIFNVTFAQDYFATLFSSSDITYDFNTHKWFVPFDLTLGRTFGKDYVVSAEVEVPIVKDLPSYDLQVELRFGVFF